MSICATTTNVRDVTLQDSKSPSEFKSSAQTKKHRWNRHSHGASLQPHAKTLSRPKLHMLAHESKQSKQSYSPCPSPSPHQTKGMVVAGTRCTHHRTTPTRQPVVSQAISNIRYLYFNAAIYSLCPTYLCQTLHHLISTSMVVVSILCNSLASPSTCAFA